MSSEQHGWRWTTPLLATGVVGLVLYWAGKMQGRTIRPRVIYELPTGHHARWDPEQQTLVAFEAPRI